MGRGSWVDHGHIQRVSGPPGMDDDVHLASHAVLALISSLTRDVAAHEQIVLEVAFEESNEGVTHSVMAPAAGRAEGIAIERMERRLLQISGITKGREAHGVGCARDQ